MGVAKVICVLFDDRSTAIPSPIRAMASRRSIIIRADKRCRRRNRSISSRARCSDHVDLQAAIDHKVTVAEATYSNSISVSEHVVMMILGLVRNYIPSYEWVMKGGWNIADCVTRSYDVEGMHVGTVAAGRTGLSVSARTY